MKDIAMQKLSQNQRKTVRMKKNVMEPITLVLGVNALLSEFAVNP